MAIRVFLLLACVCVGLPATALAQIAPIASPCTSNPADAGTNNVTPITVTPPASMADGDLVIAWAGAKAVSRTLSMTESGGQTWTNIDSVDGEHEGNGLTTSIWWAKFNGTWSGTNPTFAYDGAGGVNFTAGLCAIRSPEGASAVWSIDAGPNEADVASTSSSTITGITRTAAAAVALAFHITADNNDHTAISGSGWAVLGGNQYVNNDGTDHTWLLAYSVGTGATGNVTRDYLNGPDAGQSWIVSFGDGSGGGGGSTECRNLLLLGVGGPCSE